MGLRGGVGEVQINDSMYRIIARGNGFTDSEQVHDFVLLRASEIAISRGYKGFVITGETDRNRTDQFATSGRATTNTAIVNGIATSTTSYRPPQTTTTYKPGTAVEVTLVQSGGMDARMINATLAPRYGATPMVPPTALETPAPQLPDPQANMPPPARTPGATGDAPIQHVACTREEEKRAYLARVTGHPYQSTCNAETLNP